MINPPQETEGRARATAGVAQQISNLFTDPAGDPFTALQPVQLRPTGQGGVFAVCLAHTDEVHVLAVDSFDRPVSLGELAYSAREHMAEQHQGPPLCTCFHAQDGTDDVYHNEGCPKHGYMARQLHAAGDYDALISRARVALGAPRGAAPGPGGPTAEQTTDALFAALAAARAALQGADLTCRFHRSKPGGPRGVFTGCPICAQIARVQTAVDALDVFKPAEVTG